MFLNRQFSVFFLCMASLLLTACGRDNPLITPDPFVEPVVEPCVPETAMYKFMEAIEIRAGRESKRIDTTLARQSYEFAEGYIALSATITSYFTAELSLSQSDFSAATIDYLTELAGEQLESPTQIEIDEFIDSEIAKIEVVDFDFSYSSENEDIDRLLGTANITSGGESGAFNLTPNVTETIDIEIDVELSVPNSIFVCEGRDVEESSEVNINRIYRAEITRDAQSSFGTEAFIPFNLDADDEFGTTVVMSSYVDRNNDIVNVIAVAIPGNDSSEIGVFNRADLSALDRDTNNDAIDSGAVVVYVEDTNAPGTYVMDAYIKASNAEAGDRFGYSIAINENLLAVSAVGEDSAATESDGRQDDNLAPDSGAVYVFSKDLTTDLWSQQAYLKPPSHDIGLSGYDKGFGEVLELTGSDLYVSAPREDKIAGSVNPSVNDAGAVYKFSASSFAYLRRITSPNAGVGDLFGQSLDAHDAYLLIGAPFEDSDSTEIGSTNLSNDDQADTGAAYLFENDIFRVYFKPSISDENDGFGTSVGVYDDTIFIGSPGDDSNGDGFNLNMNDNSLVNSGAVFGYSFDEDLMSWKEFVYIKPTSPQDFASFGARLALDEDKLLVSSPDFENQVQDGSGNNEVTEGRVYLYSVDEEPNVSFLFEEGLGFEEDKRGDSAAYGSSIDLWGQSYVLSAPGIDDLDAGGNLDSENTGMAIIKR